MRIFGNEISDFALNFMIEGRLQINPNFFFFLLNMEAFEITTSIYFGVAVINQFFCYK